MGRTTRGCSHSRGSPGGQCRSAFVSSLSFGISSSERALRFKTALTGIYVRSQPPLGGAGEPLLQGGSRSVSVRVSVSVSMSVCVCLRGCVGKDKDITWYVAMQTSKQCSTLFSGFILHNVICKTPDTSTSVNCYAVGHESL